MEGFDEADSHFSLRHRRWRASMKQTVTSLYDTYDDAVAAAGALAKAGIPISDISIISNNADNRSERTHHAADDAKKGAGIGAAVGAGLGAAVGGIGGVPHGLGGMGVSGGRRRGAGG